MTNQKGIRFNCAGCGTPYFIHEDSILMLEVMSGGKIIPYCNMCVPPEDYKKLEEVETWDFEMTEDEWKEIMERQRRK